MATVSSDQPLASGQRVTSAQRLWLGMQAAFLVSAIAWQCAMNLPALREFCTDRTGITMAATALLLLVVNFAGQLGGFVALNRSIEARPPLHHVLVGLLCGGCFVLFYLPSLFVLWIGPAAVHIRATLLAP